MQVDPSAPSSSSSAPYGGWAAFPPAHATSPAFGGQAQQPQPQPQAFGQHPPSSPYQHPAQGSQKLKRTRSDDGAPPEPTVKRPTFATHFSSPNFPPPAQGYDKQAVLLHMQQHEQALAQQQQYLLQQQQDAAFASQHGSGFTTPDGQPPLARMEDMGAGVSFMGYAAHELHAGGMDDDDEMDDDECTNPTPSRSSPEPAHNRPPPLVISPYGLPIQTPMSTPHHSPTQPFRPLPALSPLSHSVTTTSAYSYGSPRPLQPPAPKPAGGYTMGPRADCEKCRLGVKGHWGHIGGNGR